MANNLSPVRGSQSYHGHEGNQIVEVSLLVTDEDEQSVDLTPVVELSPLVTDEDEQSVDLTPGLESSTLTDEDKVNFRKLVMKNKWEEVTKRYKTNHFYHDILFEGKATVLHIAVYTRTQEEVTELVNAIIASGNEKSLSTKNERGDTPLHHAAFNGWTDLCRAIIGKEGERKHLITEKNTAGETPLFWAVCGNKLQVFLDLEQFYPRNIPNAIDNEGTSILHIAIIREMFDLAILIMLVFDIIIDRADNHGTTPIETLATKTSAFETGLWLPWWKQILYYCVPTGKDNAKSIQDWYEKEYRKKKNDKECYIDIPKSLDDKKLSEQIPSLFEELRTIKKKQRYGPTLLHIFMHYNKDDISTHETNKNKQEDSKNIDGKDTTIMAIVKSGIAEIMEGLSSEIPITSDEKGLLLVAMNNLKRKGKSDVRNTAYLIAASNGIPYIMEKLRKNNKIVVFDTNSNDENALLLAVRNMHPHVIQSLKKNLSKLEFLNLTRQFDKNKNTMLHLAAFTSSYESESTWTVCGVALKMMWDVKWYKYIKGLGPSNFINRSNKDGKTPGEIFNEKHKELLQKSVEWMKDTAESCSVVAALIAGVSFATSGSVPGGNEQSGEPTFRGQPAFEEFVIFSLIGLYFSVTALIMFLTILTSRKEFDDFHLNLPIKLLLGLISLFVSIFSMLVSFCSGHFFVLTEKYTKGGILFYLYISIFFPVALYVNAQLPLIADLSRVIFKKVPPSSIKGVVL